MVVEEEEEEEEEEEVMGLYLHSHRRRAPRGHSISPWTLPKSTFPLHTLHTRSLQPEAPLRGEVAATCRHCKQ